MFVITLACLLAAASAAPHYRHHGHGHQYSRFQDDFGSFNDDVFDTARFWQQLETEMQAIEKMLSGFHAHFSVAAASAGVVGTEYKVRMTLPGFEEKDIVVKARDGVLMVQAVHKSEDGSERNYIDMRALPSNVNPAGLWGYSNEVLTISFPLNGVSTSTEATALVTTETHVTQAPDLSPEQIDMRESDNGAVDSSLNSWDNKDTEIRTNEIPKQAVEATTYAVDLKDQYEFVPVHYRK